MKNLLLLLTALLLTIVSCTKKELELIPSEQKCIENQIQYSENAIKAMNGLLCTNDGIQVSVIVDTTFYRISEYIDTTIITEHKEYFYYIYANTTTIWCNEKYLVDCN